MNETMKNKCRKVIRWLMVILGAILLLVALGIPVTNNAVALGLEKQLKALPTPENTTVVASYSQAGRLDDAGTGMAYCAAIMVESTLSEEQLQEYYSHRSIAGAFPLQVCRNEAFTLFGESAPFDAYDGGNYVVTGFGEAPASLRWLLNLDMRG